MNQSCRAATMMDWCTKMQDLLKLIDPSYWRKLHFDAMDLRASPSHNVNSNRKGRETSETTGRVLFFGTMGVLPQEIFFLSIIAESNQVHPPKSSLVLVSWYPFLWKREAELFGTMSLSLVESQNDRLFFLAPLEATQKSARPTPMARWLAGWGLGFSRRVAEPTTLWREEEIAPAKMWLGRIWIDCGRFGLYLFLLFRF